MPETITQGRVFQDWAEFDAHGPGAMKWDTDDQGRLMLCFIPPDGQAREVYAHFDSTDPHDPGNKRRCTEDYDLPSFGATKLTLEDWAGRITDGSIITITGG